MTQPPTDRPLSAQPWVHNHIFCKDARSYLTALPDRTTELIRTYRPIVQAIRLGTIESIALRKLDVRDLPETVPRTLLSMIGDQCTRLTSLVCYCGDANIVPTQPLFYDALSCVRQTTTLRQIELRMGASWVDTVRAGSIDIRLGYVPDPNHADLVAERQARQARLLNALAGHPAPHIMAENCGLSSIVADLLAYNRRLVHLVAEEWGTGQANCEKVASALRHNWRITALQFIGDERPHSGGYRTIMRCVDRNLAWRKQRAEICGLVLPLLQFRLSPWVLLWLTDKIVPPGIWVDGGERPRDDPFHLRKLRLIESLIASYEQIKAQK